MITKVQSVDLERLGIEEGTCGGTSIFLGGGNRIDFMGGLGMREWEQEDQVKRGMGEGVERRSMWRDSWN